MERDVVVIVDLVKLDGRVDCLAVVRAHLNNGLDIEVLPNYRTYLFGFPVKLWVVPHRISYCS